MQTKTEHPYILCQIRDRGGDMSKRWCVEWYVWNTQTQQLYRKRDTTCNKYKTRAARMAAAKAIKKEIDKALVQGFVYVPNGNKQPKRDSNLQPYTAISKCAKEVNKIKLARSSERTGISYRSYEKIFEVWLKKENIGHLPVANIKYNHLEDFIYYLKTELKVKNRTVNNYFVWVRAIFNHLVKQKVLSESPAALVSKLREEEATHHPYHPDQRKIIKEHLLQHDPQLYLAALFIYYTFVRPKELRLLRISHLQGDKLFIPGDISKNKKSEYVEIPNAMHAELERFHILSYPAHYYIFGNAGVPGPQAVGTSTWANQYRPIMNELGIPKEHTLYSWKHTGVIELYRQLKDIKKVQRQCRHHDISMTDKYMRQLGLFDNDEVKTQFPAF